jgi:hypothetical protein
LTSAPLSRNSNLNQITKLSGRVRGWCALRYPKKSMHKLPLFALLLSFVVTVLHASEYKAPDVTGDPIKVTSTLYTDLQKFKSEPSFHRMGFKPTSPKTKYRLWFEAYQKAQKDPRYNKALIAKGVVLGDLMMLGSEYTKSKGKETDYSKFITSEFKKALKL